MTLSNSEAELQRRARRRADILDQIAELQEEMKAFKAEDKADGFDEKALARCIAEERRGAKFQADQLAAEAVLDTYRRALGLPTDLEDAQRRAREEAGEVPEVEGDDSDARLERAARRVLDSGATVTVTEGRP